MALFYPKTIEPKYSSRPDAIPNSTGCKSNYQAMKGSGNLKNDSSTIAYWGDRFPDKTHSQNPIRYYPNTITSFVGSWNIPSPFTVTEWNIPKTIADDGIVTKIKIEYAITHVQYRNEHVQNAGWSYNSEGCKFYKKELSSSAGNVKAESGGLAKNCQTDYIIQLTGFGETKTVSGKGLEYSQRTTKNLDKYSSMPSYNSVIYSGNNKKLNIGKLRTAKIKFILPRNLNWDIGRIVMKYIRINVEYTPIEPTYEISSFTITPNNLTTCPESKAKASLTIKSTNGHTDTVKVKLSGKGVTSGKITNVSDAKNFKDNIWTVKNFSSKGTATLTYNVSYKNTGTYQTVATVQSKSKTQTVTVGSCRPTFDFILLQDNVDGQTHKPGNVYSYTTRKFEFSTFDDKSGFFQIIFNKDSINNDTESIVIDTGGLKILEWQKGENTNVNITQQEDTGLWIVSNVNRQTNIVLYGLAKFNIAGTYAVTATYTNLTHVTFNTKKTYEIIVKGTNLGKEYFKMRLEDGSDIRYNSLMFTKGDDLKIPLTYTTEDVYNHGNDMIIIGGKKRIPVGEIQYIDFDITLQTNEDIELNNVLTYIEAVSDGIRCDDIVVGSSSNVKLIDNDSDEKICVIESITSKEPTKVRFAVQSETERECFLYIKPYNIKEPYTYIDEYKTFMINLPTDEISIDTADLKPGKYLATIDYSGDNKNKNFIENNHAFTISSKAKENKATFTNIDIPSNATGTLTITVPTKKWKPAHIYFKDIPNVKIWIEGVHEVNTSIEDKFSLYYHIQNLSDVAGKNVRFQIQEPYNFNKIGYSLYHHTNEDEYNIENGRDKNAPWFNENNRIITFPVLEPQSVQQDYRLRIDYQATTKGIYDFVIKTLDDINNLDDDQYENYYKHKVLVDILSDVQITTSVSKKLPYVDELIDFHINIKNRFKDQKEFTFNIYDIGRYESKHTDNHYIVQPYTDCQYGTFVPSEEEGNKIGTWTLTDIKANTEYDLTITLQPTTPGTHTIQTIFYDNNDGNENTQDFENKVKILARKKQISFNVYQAVDDDDSDCSDCDKLTQICDDDFINLKDKIYYVFEIVNNSRDAITNNIYAYARLPESFLEKGILCQSRISNLDKNSNLLSFTIPGLKGCEDKIHSKVKFCIKLEPSQVGKFISNFSLVTRNADIINKQLKLTVDTEFNERKLEHEINIYNFDKTNKYYRYEIDNNGEIFKFYNTGDKSVRLIDHEQYNKSAVEKYKGTNLRQIIKDIKDNSKYVDPILLKEGSNKLTDKGYELYPDGFMRRFGLLRSEVFHYSHQFPITSNLIEKVMRWETDMWDTKIWGGDIYDNGVFDLSIDYAKVPSNFNILDVDHPINNLQQLVDKVKPYGTKALCYYSATVHLKLKMFIDEVNVLTNHYIKLSFKIAEDQVGVISAYSRHDKSLDIYYDMFRLHFDTAIKDIRLDMKYNQVKDIDSDHPTLIPYIDNVDTIIYETRTDKQYIQDCYDIVSNIYSTKEKNNNIDIIKPYNHQDFTEQTSSSLINQQIINFTNKLDDKQSINLKIEEPKTSKIYTYNPHFSDGILTVPDKNDIIFTFERNDIEYFTGFKIIIEGETVESYNITDPIDKVSMQVQLCRYSEDGDNYAVLHFWASVNDKDYHHIGHLLSTAISQPIIKIDNQSDIDDITIYECDIDNKITFKLSDKVNVIRKQFDHLESMERTNKWNYLKNINSGKGKYASFKNSINIDKKCSEHEEMEIPKLIMKYNGINLDDTDEVVDIAFKIKAHSNKNWAEDVNINVFKDGDAYIPENKTARKIYYPSQVKNTVQEFLATMQIQQPNITICSNCLKTSLGYYEQCPHCNSYSVYHTNEKMAATVCHRCGYITKGWHDRCTYCLSYDIDKVKIDYNKTYCQDCQTLSDDYYNYCPKCFSPNVTHLTNDRKVYQIFDKDSQNIDPITINTVADRVNIFNIEIPFNNKTSAIDKNTLEYLTLNVYGTNHNNGEYYYCESCNTGGLGHYETCPQCNSKLVHNHRVDNYIMDVYHQTLDTNQIAMDHIATEPIHQNFNTRIELQDMSLQNMYDSYSLLFYIENKKYNEIYNEIAQLPIDDESIGNIVDGLMKMHVTIDNMSLDYKYVNQQEWSGLDRLYGMNHTGITYDTAYNKRTTDNITFEKFNIPIDTYKHAFLHIHGIAKNTDQYKIHFDINNNGEQYEYELSGQSNDIFDYQIDLTTIVKGKLHNPRITIFFKDIEPNSQITILGCDILTEKEQSTTIVHDDINKIDTTFHEDNGYYLFTSKSNNIWGLKDTAPYYLSGRQLDTNLIVYIDFGSVNLEEYLRLYSIEMIVLYKNKMGQIITETIPIKEIQNTESLNKNTNVLNDSLYPEQNFNGDIQRINGEAWLSLKYPIEILNNLEYDVTNIGDDGEILNAIPLRNKVAQSFILPSTDISGISVKCHKRRGYPSDIINVSICKDNNNQPGNIIRANKVKVDNILQTINIDLDADGLSSGHKYWFVIEDVYADKYNYHQFEYNNNTNVGQLIKYENGKIVVEPNTALSFAINSNDSIKDIYTLPTFWSADSDGEKIDYDGYKMFITFYRYNIQDSSNISASNLHVKYGYAIKEKDEDVIDED